MSRRLGIPDRVLALVYAQDHHYDCISEGPLRACGACTVLVFSSMEKVYGDRLGAELRMAIEADLLAEPDDRD